MPATPPERLPTLAPLDAVTLLRALVKRPVPVSSVVADASYRLERIDLAHVRRYNQAFGFPGEAVPLTFLYLLAQRAQLAAMLDRPTPFRIPGLIHVENRLDMHGPVSPDAPLTLTTSTRLPPPAVNGALTCVLATRAYDGERLAFACDSTYLIRRGKRSGHADAPQPQPGELLGTWTVARDAGRRYAALSGDWNPIHLWPWSARLMGMRRPIIHGAYTLARACAQLQAVSDREVTSAWCRFRQPVALGAQVSLLHDADAGSFAVLCDGRLALEGRAS